MTMSAHQLKQPTMTQKGPDERVSAFKALHSQAYLYIEQGLSCCESNHLEEAATLYARGLRIMDEALTIDLHDIDNEKVRQMIQKMQKTQLEVRYSLEAIHATPIQPPSYAESPIASAPLYPLLELNLAGSSEGVQDGNAVEIFSIPDGVQTFFITSDDRVSVPSYPSGLSIYFFSDSSAERPPAFLRVGNWTYPLVPGSSPVLRAEFGAYIFPDVLALMPVCLHHEGSSVGVILPDFVSDEERQRFQDIISNITAFKEQSPGEGGEIKPQRTSEWIAKGLVTAGEWVAWGLEKGAEKGAKCLQYGSVYLQGKLEPGKEPSKIHPNLQKGVEYAHGATTTAVHVSNVVIDKLGDATAALGRYLAPHVRRAGERILPRSWSQSSENGNSRMDDVAVVAYGGLQSWAAIFTSLENAANALARSLADETVHVVKHKYGSEASSLTQNAVYSAVNVGLTVSNARRFGTKAVAARVTKEISTVVTRPNLPEASDAKKESPRGDATAEPKK